MALLDFREVWAKPEYFHESRAPIYTLKRPKTLSSKPKRSTAIFVFNIKLFLPPHYSAILLARDFTERIRDSGPNLVHWYLNVPQTKKVLLR